MRSDHIKARFEEVFTLQMGKTPDRKNPALFDGNNTWVSIRDLGEKYISSSNECISDEAAANINIVKKGTVMMSFKLTVGKCAIASKDLYTNEAIMAFNVKDGYEIDSSFLYYYLQNYRWEGANKAVMGQTLNKATISKQIICIPSISIQQNIVSELDKINELISLKKEQLSDYDKLAQSLFYEMFGDPIENEKSWEVKKFGEIASFKNGLNFGKNENGYSYKILGVGDFKDNFVVNSSSLEYINLNEELSSDYFLKPEDMVFVRSNGSKELVGRCVSVDCTEPTTYSGFCIRCRLNEDSGVLPMYLLYVCKNKGIREYLTQSGRGCNISNVNQKILNSTDIIIPPLSNQELFIQRIKLIEQQKTEIQSTIANLETLLASRMQFWFD